MQNNSFDNRDFVANDVAADLVRDLIKEKRADRRWKNIRLILILLFFACIALFVFVQTSPMLSAGEGKDYVSLIHLEGMIGPGEDFSAEAVAPLLKDAFADTQAKGVVLVIDSGGGTPVQASIMHDMILELKKKYNKKVVVVGEDLLASGAYFVAVAADKIYVNPNTITGSIGVIMKGFGFPELIKKLGVERRVITSGENKDRLDPFLPQTQEDLEKIRQVIDEVHNNFNQVVLQGREGKLHADPKVLFSGDFWSGQTALKLGLVDGLGNLSNVLRDEFQVSRYKDYSLSRSMLKNVVGQFGSSLDMALGRSQVGMLEKI